MSKITISLLGCRLDSGNMGVSALAASLAKLFSLTDNDVYINLLIGNKNNDPQHAFIGNKKFFLNVVNYRLSFHCRFHQHLLAILLMTLLYRFSPLKSIKNKIVQKNNWIRTILQSDIIGDIQGGDSFSDIYGQKLFLLHALPLLIILLLKKKYILLPQTYGPYGSNFSRFLARYLIIKASKVYSRDKEGLTYLQSLLKKKITKIPVIFCPDVAFTMDPQAISNPLILPPLSPHPGILIGLNINGLMYNGGYTRNNMFALALNYPLFIYKLIKQLLLSDNKTHLLIIPHTFGKDDNVDNDPQAGYKVMAEIEKTDAHLVERIHLLKSEHNAHELKSLIGLCHFFIGSRMHSCIAALSQNIPTIGIAYSYKFIGVFNSIGLGQGVIDARYTDMHEAINKIEELINSNPEEQFRQKSSIEKIQKQIYSVFQNLISETLEKN